MNYSEQRSGHGKQCSATDFTTHGNVVHLDATSARGSSSTNSNDVHGLGAARSQTISNRNALQADRALTANSDGAFPTGSLYNGRSVTI